MRKVKKMDENITYGVYWQSKRSLIPYEWHRFFDWLSVYEDAESMARELKRDPNCLAIKIVKRVETFEDVPGTLWERNNNE